MARRDELWKWFEILPELRNRDACINDNLAPLIIMVEPLLNRLKQSIFQCLTQNVQYENYTRHKTDNYLLSRSGNPFVEFVSQAERIYNFLLLANVLEQPNRNKVTVRIGV